MPNAPILSARPDRRPDMNRLSTLSPLRTTTSAAVLTALLIAPPALAQDDDVDRRVVRKVDRVVLSDDLMQVQPCENYETDHPDAVRRSHRGYLGVELTSMTDDLLRHFGVPDDGVMISRVTEGSPAERSGLRVGDIVSRFDGRRLDSTRELGRAVRGMPGTTAVAEVWRDGKMQNVSVTVGEKEMCSLDLGALMEGLDFNFDFEGLDFDADELGRVAAELGARGAEIGLRVADEVARAMAEIDWEAQMDALEAISEIDEERMEALQDRLEELEERMEEEYERFGEEYERKMEAAMREKERALRAQERAVRQRLEAQSEQRRQHVEEQAARAEARRAEAEVRAKEAEERRRALEAEDDEDGGETLDI